MTEQTTEEKLAEGTGPTEGQPEHDAAENQGLQLEDTGEAGADEGDIAADYLEELLDIVDLDGDIDIEIRGARTFLSIQAEEGAQDLEDLVGSRGEVLDALQELTRLAVLAATGERTRLVLDINGHRAARNEELKQLAKDAVTKVEGSGEPVHLDPMTAYERKIVHDFVAEAGLVSESEGEGKRRHVVVSSE